jgi:glucokinase
MNYIGIDIGGTNLKAGLVNDEGSILAMEKRKIAEVSDQKALVEALVALTQSLTERGGLTPEQIRSVGVGVPGAVEIHSGAVLYTCNLPLRNVPLRKLFHRYLPYPLYVENDANCAALAEYYAGAGKGSKRFVTITLGTGVGAGILHNGQIYHGANGMAGEVGHMSIVYHGEPCPCGRRGCWERYAATTALVRAAQEENPAWKDGRAIFAAAEAGNETVLALLDAWTDEIAQGLAGMVHIFNPQLILIGGGVSAQQKLLIEPIAEKVKASVMPAFAEGLEIRAAQLHNDAGMVGAVYYFRQTMEKE